MSVLAAHADWSVDARKRWMAVARPVDRGWRVRVEPVGDVATLFARLRAEAAGAPVALGVDFPLGLPRDYALRHGLGLPDFPAFLRGLAQRPEFFRVCSTLDEVTPARPFYPQRGGRGMTWLSHAQALGMADAAGLHRACDRATATRPAGAPLFWTLGANQTGKAGLAAWHDLLLPALATPDPPALWPFEGPFRALLQPGGVAVAETYPAEAMRQLGLKLGGSKRRHSDRLRLASPLRGAMLRLDARPERGLDLLLEQGLGADAAAEDRLDCLLGVLNVLLVLTGGRPDTAPADPWVQHWEGWVLGQT